MAHIRRRDRAAYAQVEAQRAAEAAKIAADAQRYAPQQRVDTADGFLAVAFVILFFVILIGAPLVQILLIKTAIQAAGN